MNIGDNMFDEIGLVEDYFAARGHITRADAGRFNATGTEEDRRHFRVPSLRNVALTAPYFHDGSAATLDQAIGVESQLRTLSESMAQGDGVNASRAAHAMAGLAGNFNALPVVETARQIDGLCRTGRIDEPVAAFSQLEQETWGLVKTVQELSAQQIESQVWRSISFLNRR